MLKSTVSSTGCLAAVDVDADGCCGGSFVAAAAVFGFERYPKPLLYCFSSVTCTGSGLAHCWYMENSKSRCPMAVGFGSEISIRCSSLLVLHTHTDERDDDDEDSS